MQLVPREYYPDVHEIAVELYYDGLLNQERENAPANLTKAYDLLDSSRLPVPSDCLAYHYHPSAPLFDNQCSGNQEST